MTCKYETAARAEGWDITIDSRDRYVADDDDYRKAHNMPEGEPYYLDAEDEDDAWKELCRLEGIQVPA